MATPTADTIRQTVHNLADYMDQRGNCADVNPAVTLDEVYRQLHVVINQLVELDEASKVLPELYGARMVDAPEGSDRRFVVEVYDLGTHQTIATSIPIDYAMHMHHALSLLNVDGHTFRIIGKHFRTMAGVYGVNHVVRKVAIEAEQPPVPVN